MSFSGTFTTRSGQLAATTGLLLTALIACRQPGTEFNDSATFFNRFDSWQSPLYLEHTLAGQIWRVEDQQPMSPGQLMQEISAARFLLLGEKHDNPDHHRLQLAILRGLLADGLVSSVSFEMLDSRTTSGLEQVERGGFDSMEELRELLQWDEEGWNWDFYGPLVAESLNAGVEVRAANISPETVGQVYVEPLDPQIAAVLNDSALEQLNIEIDQSHCNMLPPSQFPAMVRVQQARDHQMASSLGKAGPRARLDVLVAGNFHVRHDLGVPGYLRSLRPDVPGSVVVSLALLEVNPESDNPADYLQAYSDVLPYDYVWFTPAISDEDYCAGFSR